jgi:hypothetical protein
MSNNVNFFDKIYNGFQKSKSKTMNKQDMIDIMPKNLTTKAKIKKLTEFSDEMSEKEFIKFLRMQTDGSDYVNFDYIIRYYGLKTDQNNMIIFTRKFKFDNRIKKEALFIWGILNSIKNDPILGKFRHYITKDLQTKFTVNLLNNNTGSKFDLCFKELKIAVEIDENHTSDKVINNDEIKSSMMKLNGYNLTRLDFQEINRGSTIVGDINEIILNNEYYRKFIIEIKRKLLTSLLYKYVDVREYYIMHLYRRTIKNKKITTTNRITEIKKNIIKCKEECAKSIDITNYEIQYIKLQNLKLINGFNDSLYIEFSKILNEINLVNSDVSNDFKNLFDLKNKCKESNYTNVITFTDIIKLLKINPDKFNGMKLNLCKYGIIEDYDLNYDKILISWKQLSTVINNSNDAQDLQKLLIAYYIEVEESYEKIINMISIHTKSISGSEEDYNICMKYIIERNSKSDKNLITKLNNDIIELKNINFELESKNKYLKSLNNIYEQTNEPRYLPMPHEEYEEISDEQMEFIDQQMKLFVDCDIDNLDTPEEFARKNNLVYNDIKNIKTDIDDASSISNDDLSDDGF